MLVNDNHRLSQIVDADLRAIPAGGPNGTDMLDVALCAAGIRQVSATRRLGRWVVFPCNTNRPLAPLGVTYKCWPA